MTAVDVDGHVARIHRDPALPDPSTLPDGAVRQGTWWVTVDDARLTGGEWTAERCGDMVTIDLVVTERWRPRGLPPLMRVVTLMVPVFRRWPTTYRWRAVVTLGDAPVLRSAWERTGHERGETYRRRTGG